MNADQLHAALVNGSEIHQYWKTRFTCAIRSKMIYQVFDTDGKISVIQASTLAALLHRFKDVSLIRLPRRTIYAIVERKICLHEKETGIQD